MTSLNLRQAITIKPNPNRVQVTFNGTVIEGTQRALMLREGPLPPAQYILRDIVNMAFLHFASLHFILHTLSL